MTFSFFLNIQFFYIKHKATITMPSYNNTILLNSVSTTYNLTKQSRTDSITQIRNHNGNGKSCLICGSCVHMTRVSITEFDE